MEEVRAKHTTTKSAVECCAENEAGERKGTHGWKRTGQDQDLSNGLHDGGITEAETHVCFKII